MEKALPYDPMKYVVTGYSGPVDSDKQIETIDPEMAERVQFIVDLLGMCFSRRVIIQKFLEEFPVGRSMAYRYYKTAEWEIREEANKNRAERVAESINNMRVIAKRALTKGDHAAAVSAIKYRDAVIGLTEAFNEPGAGNAADAGRVDPLDAESARNLAETIARAQAAITDGQHDVVGPEQLPNG